EFSGYVDSAREKFTEARELLATGEETDTAKALVREAHDLLKSANTVLMGIVRDIHGAGEEIEEEPAEVTVVEDTEDEDVPVPEVEDDEDDMEEVEETVDEEEEEEEVEETEDDEDDMEDDEDEDDEQDEEESSDEE
ncbi:hypothetical protein KY326_03880, partial [Candidatus Woesearchaeota archaeon]|nr:hypothetical protein [Candidatus Woesearchaeota archaeon]